MRKNTAKERMRGSARNRGKKISFISVTSVGRYRRRVGDREGGRERNNQNQVTRFTSQWKRERSPSLRTLSVAAAWLLATTHNGQNINAIFNKS